jgi:large subunit ribosomal protein L29
MSKAAEKIGNLSPDELKHQEKEQMDQLFRLKFQMKMGQSESLNKIRTLRRNVARLKTFRRQHELGIATAAVARKTEAAPKAKKTSSKAATKSTKKATAGKAGKK